MQDITPIVAICGAAFGLTGAILGVINTWRAFDRDRVKLKVVPVWIGEAHGEGFGVEVINLSSFPVTITGMGFTQRHTDVRLAFMPSDIRNCQLPLRMEPRTSTTAIVPAAGRGHSDWKSVDKAYVNTACGGQYVGTSGALKQMIKSAR